MAMFESFFEMENTPFGRNVPPEYLYQPEHISEAKGRLRYVAKDQLFAVVTGDPGCGKTTLIRDFAQELPKDDYILLYLSDSKLTPRWLYSGLLDQLGLESKFYRGDAKRRLQEEVEILQGGRNKKVVCVLDEAHLLEKETLEEFRFLLNYRFDSMSPMALILVAPGTLRMMAAVIGSVYALGVGVAVIALDWHRPSDVLGAYLVVTAWTVPAR